MRIGPGDARRHGVQVIGYLDAELGIGQAARMLVAGLEAADIPLVTHTYEGSASRRQAEWRDRARRQDVDYTTSIIGINPDHYPHFLDHDGGERLLHGTRRIGWWAWETEDFPASFLPSLDRVDEVWVNSGYTAAILQRHTAKPVLVAPQPIHVPARSSAVPHEIAEAAGFTFSFLFDYLSVFERKNPLGLVRAYRRAFPEPGEARLVIKTVNAEKRPEEQQRLIEATHDRPDIVLIERYLAREEVDALMWATDCYVSLHRCEGFGLTIAEAMSIAKPVIVTGYSGNLTFTTPHNSRLVPYEMVPVPPGCDPYPTTSSWADPRPRHAARKMRRLFEDGELRERIGTRGARRIARRHSVVNLARFAQARLSDPR